MSAFSPSKIPIRNSLSKRTWLLLLGATVISLGGYLTASAIHPGIGFPLDDAWIHQTYARNLALRGEWAFIPGQPSGGSTSPLWTVLLSLGYFLRIPPLLWTFFLGGLLLFGLAVLFERGIALIVEDGLGRIPLAGLLIIFEWHFVWSSLSGMETLLHAVVVLSITLLLVRKSPPWLILGFLVGLSTWVRPDGLTLLGPILFTAMIVEKDLKKKASAMLQVLLCFGVLFAPYLIFNFALIGKIFPMTFYAKQAEYVSWQSRPLLSRVGELTLQFLVGIGVILLPGVVLQVDNSLKRKNWGIISMFIWMLGYLGIYLIRLPAYQHGRYLIPALPIFLLFGFGGFIQFLSKKQVQTKPRQLLKFSWGTTLLLIGLGFWIMGLDSFRSDVEFIETEMVDTAKWVANNIPGDKLIAAHDIGALGYFDQHPLVDLAGLITPDVIPFLRDEEQLSNYLDEHDVAFLVAFPDWYPSLTSDLIPVFTTGAAYSPSVGKTNMIVYRWQDP